MRGRSTSGEEPAKHVEERELPPELSRAFSALAFDARTAIWLHTVEGEDVGDIARWLQTSRSTVWRRIREGLEQLRSALRDRGLVIAAGFSLERALSELPSATASCTSPRWRARFPRAGSASLSCSSPRVDIPVISAL